MLDLIIKNGLCYIDGKLQKQDIGINKNKISEIGSLDSKNSKEVIDAENLTVLPGCIDTQTHFREPGSTDTEDLHSGSRAAIVGGITSVFEMPNTNPPTSNKVEFQKKLDLAKNRMYCNYAFYFGATADNANELSDLKDLEGCCGIKLFAGSSTGNLLENSFLLEVGGFVFGISNTEVIPPAIAALLPECKSSASVEPGSLK